MSNRDRIIASIVAKPLGIFGADVCRRCGQEKTFAGWAAAMATHPDGSAFICMDCVREIAPGDVIGEDERAAIDAELARAAATRPAPADPDHPARVRRRYLELTSKDTAELRLMDLRGAAQALEREEEEAPPIRRRALRDRWLERWRALVAAHESIHGVTYCVDDDGEVHET